VLGLPYDFAVDMWSFGCILAEMATGRPLFPAQDENELMEYYKVRVGLPPLDMVQSCSKKRQFFDVHNNLIRSKKSRLPPNAGVRSLPIRDALYCEDDSEFIEFIEVIAHFSYY
jgi:dual specificity tyrosine-phosphorylation-regulated kinase 2/3/4